MTGQPRTRVVHLSLAVLALLVLPAVGLGQPGVQNGFLGGAGGPGGPGPATTDGATVAELFPQNALMARQLQQTAPQYIDAAKRGDRDWVTVAEILQPVLDLPTDFLFKKEEKGQDGKVSFHYTSGRAEAERLLARLPQAGLTAYEVKYGGAAQIALAKARGNPALLDEVARRFYLTKAGAEALTQLGVSELDHGHAEEAADRFRRLLERPDPAALPPMTLFQAALAFHAVADAARETQAMQLLSRSLPPAGLNVGGQVLTINDFQKEVARWPLAPAVASADWPVFRGDLRRTGRADGDFPMLEPRDPSVVLPTYPEVVRALAAPPNTVPVAPGLPGFVPIAVAGKIIYRGPDGLHALDGETGKEVWRHVPPPGRPSLCLASVLKDDNQRLQVLDQWLPKYAGLPGLPDENAALGTLSSDARHVFYVEDVPVPAHPNDVIALQQPQGPQGIGHPFFSSLEETLYHNRLRAVDALTGEFRWEVGVWDRAAPPLRPEFTDVFFLGPPLPVGRRLFALVEQTAPDLKKNKEIILLCLDPDTGRLLWSQQIAAAADPLWVDAARHMQPVQLAYGDGVLVCPTNTGSVIAIDPLTHDILWAHVYHEPTPNPNGFPGFDANQYEAAWKGCAPIVQGDRVLLTAPDGDKILCLNLRDGAQVWEVARTDDDMYVGGVFADPAAGDKVLIVGRKNCRALSLAKGEEVWKGLATGDPSGLGTVCGRYYLLPLRKGDVFAIDVANPNGSTVFEGRPDDPPGNLLLHGGDLWSQSAKAVTHYKRLSEGLERATLRVTRNPKDPAARVERARLLFGKGDLAAAVEDWRAALDDDPPAELADSIRERLFKALTILLRQNFAANERYLGQYEMLCRVAPSPGATAERVRDCLAEQHRRQMGLRALTAEGWAAQGRVDLALQAYKDIFDAAAPTERMGIADDSYAQSRPDLWVGQAQSRPDLWVRGRIADLAKEATPRQQKLLSEKIDQDWQAARSAGGEANLTRFLALYGGVAGPPGATAREARLLLAERWMDEHDRRHALDAELYLHFLRDQTDSPETAAAAQYARARMLTRYGLLGDAVEAYRDLARDFPAVRLPDGRTGAAVLDDLAVDKRFVAYLDDPLAGRPTGPVKVMEIEEHNTPQPQDLACEPADGVPPPSCRCLRFTLDPQTYALKVASTDGSSEPWSAPLPVPADFLRQVTAQSGGFTPTYEANDHFLVVTLGPILVGVDRIERRARWVRSLLPADLPAGVQIQQITPGGPDGSVWILTSDSPANQRLGLLGPIGPNGVIVQTRGGVASLDVSSGALRWFRAETSPMLTGFGDEEYLYLVESRPTGETFAVRAVRTIDGVSTRIPDAVGFYNHHMTDPSGRVRTLGRCILTSGGGGDDGAPLEVHFYDVQASKDLWSGSYPPHSVVLESSLPEMTAVVTPDGTVTVVDLTTCRTAAKLSLDKSDIADPKGRNQLVRGMLLRDRTRYYVALQTLPGPKAATIGDPSVNFNGVMKFTEVNGRIYAFDRATGGLDWATNAPIESQILLLDSFEESPVLLMTALQARQVPGVPGGNQIQVAATRSIDKRTGKVLYRKEFADNNAPDQFYLLEVDPRTGTVDLVNSTMRLRHVIEAGKRE